MLNLVRKTHYIHTAYIAVTVGLVFWGFIISWDQINNSISHGIPKGIDLRYQYFMTSELQGINAILQEDFQEAQFNKAPVKFGEFDRWYKLKLTNQNITSQNLIMIMDNPMADVIEVFDITSNEASSLPYITGDLVDNIPRSQRILPSIPFQIEPKKSIEFLIKFETSGAPFLPLIFLNNAEYENYLHSLHLIWGTFIGIVLLMSAYNLVLYIGVRDRTYLLYICYIITMLIELGVVHGYGYYIFPEPIQRWFADKVIVFNSLAAYFTLHFALYFLRYSSEDGPIFLTSYRLSYAILAYAIISLYIPEYIAAQGFVIIQLVTYVLAVRIILKKIKSKFRWTKYYLISWLPFFIGAGFGFLLFSGHIEYNFFNRHALMFSIMFEMAFISMALADRLGDIEQQRLYQATHDYKLDFVNEILLEEAIHRNAHLTSRSGLTLISVEITNYHDVAPYLSESQLTEIMQGLGQSFTEQLGYSLDLIPLESTHTNHRFVSLVRGEFLSFLAQTDNANLITTTLKRLSSIDNFNPLQSQIPYRLTCIFGAATLTNYSEKPHELINHSKKAIREANQKSIPFVLFNPLSSNYSDRKIRLAQDLGHAIDQNKLELYHQPQLFFDDIHRSASEVLLRWNHPELGFICPVEFIRVAEETGLINRLTRWVINRAFMQAQQMKDNGAKHLNISINVSANDLSRPGFFNDVKEITSRYQLPISEFTLELTETSHLTDKNTFEDNLNKLKKHGFNLAIDDFGTGYSSLTYASVHPFSEIKIDRSFIHGMLRSEKQMSIVTATISLAKEIDLNITAEGVEDLKTLKELEKLKCEKAQGYFISQPMPFEVYLNWRYMSEKTIE